MKQILYYINFRPDVSKECSYLQLKEITFHFLCALSVMLCGICIGLNKFLAITRIKIDVLEEWKYARSCNLVLD